MGAGKLEQLRDNLSSLEIILTTEQLQTLDEASALNPALPNGLFSPELKQMIFGGKNVLNWK